MLTSLLFFKNQCVCSFCSSASATGTSSFFVAERLTLKIIPKYTQLIYVDVPPLLMSGRGCPVTGNTPTATAILIMACVTNNRDNPMTR